MTEREKGFLLLTSHLGDSNRHPLSVPQFRTLAQRGRTMESPQEQRELLPSDLIQLGYGREMAERIVLLLADRELLERYLQRGASAGCVPLTWCSAGYPRELLNRLGQEAPGCIWASGDLSLLELPRISLVGSRDIHSDNLRFAREVGRQAALQGFVLVSGNARGADRAAQQSCLEHGGRVISVVADELEKSRPKQNLLYLSEEIFDGAFSPQRALSRNRVIHCLGECVFVAQCDLSRGGTWDGTVKNLHQQWSPVYCYQDGSKATTKLLQMGAGGVILEELMNIPGLFTEVFSLFDE